MYNTSTIIFMSKGTEMSANEPEGDRVVEDSITIIVHALKHHNTTLNKT